MPFFVFDSLLGLLSFTKIISITPHHLDIPRGSLVLRLALHVQMLSVTECVDMDVGGVGHFCVVIVVTMLAARS